jgi:hypothetical protein
MMDTYIWRGQRDSTWLLESSLHRANPKVAGDATLTQLHLTGFKRAALGRLPDLDFHASDNRWWAAGRHAGLASPLLDWSMSPYVAAFFAFWEDPGPAASSECAVFRLGWAMLNSPDAVPVEQDVRPNDLKAYADCLALVLPCALDNPPMVRQSGVFTRLYPPHADLESWVGNHYREYSESILIKYVLPHADRDVALASLRRMNIHAASLFPDIRGSARFCNVSLSDGKYPPWLEKTMHDEQYALSPPQRAQPEARGQGDEGVVPILVEIQ